MADDSEYDATLDEPKAKDPFTDLPKSSMNLMAVKQNYQNKRQINVKYFDPETLDNYWAQHDPVGFSIHYGKYNWNDEDDLGKMDVMGNMKANNRTTGFKNSMDPNSLSHKHSMGIFKLLYSATDKEIQTVFITRGDSLHPAMFDEILDSFTWTTLDSSNVEHQQLVSAMFHTDEDEVMLDKTVKKSVLYL